MKLYIMRHGETDWNKERRLQGQVDIELNEFGRYLARETGVGMQDIQIDQAFSSPLRRAKETAQLVLGDRDITIQEDIRLQEMAFGEYEGLCCSEEGWEIPDPGFENFFYAPDQYQPPKGGESFQDVVERIKGFLKELLKKPETDDNTYLIVCHGVVVNAILNTLKDRPVARFWQDMVQKNCAVNIVEVEDGEAKILTEGYTYYADDVKAW